MGKSFYYFFFVQFSRKVDTKHYTPIAYNDWGLTKFKKYQMKKTEKTFFKFCLSPCYLSGFKKEKRRGDFFNNFFHLKMLFND